MIHLDTSMLIDGLTGPQNARAALRGALERGHILLVSTPALYEWLRGARSAKELELQETILPLASVVSFGPTEAAIAADLYRKVRRPRGREMDLAIAACALSHDAALWTKDRADFSDVPGLDLI